VIGSGDPITARGYSIAFKDSTMSPIDVINCFIREMYDWEVHCTNQIDANRKIVFSEDGSSSKVLLDELYRELCKIISKYTTLKMSNRGEFHAGIPTMYNPNVDKVSECNIKNNTAVVRLLTTDRLGDEREYMFDLENIIGEWKITVKREILPHKTKKVDII
jgi:hypothetical protein